MVNGLSVHTNPGQMSALRALGKTNKLLQATQLRITTGLRNGPKEDAATFTVATRLRGDISAMHSVKKSLDRGEAALNVAIAAGNSIKDLLVEMKGKVVQAAQASLDTLSRTSLHNEFVTLRAQINAITLSAEFQEINVVDNGAATVNILSTMDGGTIAVTANKLDDASLAINASVLNTSQSANDARTAIDSAITIAADRIANLGATARSIEIQNEFTTAMLDELTTGLGLMQDADMAAESAKVQALQIQQALGVQALNIANAGPQALLGVFGLR